MACKIASRSVLLRHCIQLWGQSKKLDDLHKILKSSPQDEIELYLSKTFKVTVETFNKHFTQKEKVDKIEVIISLICILLFN